MSVSEGGLTRSERRAMAMMDRKDVKERRWGTFTHDMIAAGGLKRVRQSKP